MLKENTYIQLESEIEFAHNGSMISTKEVMIPARTISNLGAFALLEETVMQSAIAIAEKSKDMAQAQDSSADDVIGGEEVAEIDHKVCLSMLKTSNKYGVFIEQMKNFMLKHCKLVVPDEENVTASFKPDYLNKMSPDDFEMIMGKVGANFLNKAMRENSK